MHHKEMASSQLPKLSEIISGLQIHLNHGLMSDGVGCWSPIASCFRNPSQSPNSKKRRRWSGTACHRNWSTRLL